MDSSGRETPVAKNVGCARFLRRRIVLEDVTPYLQRAGLKRNSDPESVELTGRMDVAAKSPSLALQDGQTSVGPLHLRETIISEAGNDPRVGASYCGSRARRGRGFWLRSRRKSKATRERWSGKGDGFLR